MITLSEAIRDYMTDCYALKPRTRTIYREHLNRLLQYLGDVPLEEITRRDLSYFLNSLHRQDGKDYSASYLHQIWRTLHTFFEYGAEENLLVYNPIRRVRKPDLETGDKPRLSLRQVKQLIFAVKNTLLYERNLAIILLMVDSGLRMNEVVNLKITDLDLEDETVLVKSAKTKKKRRVPLNSATVQALKVYELRRQSLATAETKMFFLTRDNLAITREAIHQVIKRLEKKLKFSLYGHLLRHTFANLYLKRGKAERLQKILGHSRIDTTTRFYTDTELEEIKQEHKFASPTGQLSE